MELYSRLPVSNDLKEEYFFPKILRSYILTSDSKEDIEKLCFDVVDWVQRMGFESLIFLGETEMPWLSQKNDAKQAKEAVQFFKAQKIDVRYNGGFIVDNRALPEFITHLFWLTRLNASFPMVYFTDKNQGLIGNLCKYGNLHIFTLSEAIDNFILTVVGESHFKLAEGMQC